MSREASKVENKEQLRDKITGVNKTIFWNTEGTKAQIPKAWRRGGVRCGRGYLRHPGRGLGQAWPGSPEKMNFFTRKGVFL